MSNTVFLLDAFALIYRAHFAFIKNPRINSKGINTSVPFGFTTTLLEILTKQKPSHIGIAFDTSAPTFRDELYKEYKATRQETPEDVSHGVPKIKEIIHAFNIPLIEVDGFEADDIIGTLAWKAADVNLNVYMMTPDKDYGQLVRPNIWLYKPTYKRNEVEILGEKEVCQKWNISHVGQVIDMLGLQGDSSDNIPGIPGIGPKTAAELLKQYGSIENIIAHADQLKGKTKERVKEHADQALLSKKLATINTQVPIVFDQDRFAYKGPDKDQLLSIFEELEFRTLTKRLFPTQPEGLSSLQKENSSEPILTEHTVASYTTITSDQELQQWVDLHLSTPYIALHTISDKAPHFNFEATAIVIAASLSTIIYTQITPQRLKLLEPILTQKRIVKIGYHLKPSLLALQKCGLTIQGPLFDIMIAHYLIEPETSHDLPVLAKQYLHTSPKEDQLNESLFYGEQINLTLQLKPILEKELLQRNQLRLMNDIEMPLIYVLTHMEYAGVKIDEDQLHKLSQQLKNESVSIEQEIHELAGLTFNIGSPKQLGEVLFDKMKLIDNVKKTKTGQYTTREDVLATLAPQHHIVKKVLEYREVEKLRSTYVDALPKMISSFDHRLHTDYRQTVAATGRLSSNNPNLQNIPIRTSKGRVIRDTFIAKSKKHVILSADYSQIELRLVACFAHDQIMIEAFRSGRDIHTTTAMRVFNIDESQVTPDMRRKAKEVNFGILYGSSAFGLAQNLSIPRKEAAEIIKAYFTEFSSIKKYIEDRIEFARTNQYVETILGRRRYLRDILSRNVATKNFSERNAINAPIQGSAADIIKIAMINIHQWLTRHNLNTRMIMQVHDELVFDVPEEELQEVQTQVPHFMQSAVVLPITLEVKTGVSYTWLGAH